MVSFSAGDAVAGACPRSCGARPVAAGMLRCPKPTAMQSAQNRIEAATAGASATLARVGHWMTAHPIQTLSISAEEIAERTGTSVSAVNRFSRAAGFEGFSDLKAVLGHELQSITDPLHKLGRSGAKEPPARRAAPAIDAQALHQAASNPAIARLAGRLLKAERVWLLGLGQSSFLTAYATHMFTPYLRNVTSLAGQGGTEVAARRLSVCGRGDVLVAVSLPRYSRDTISLASFARERGAYVIAVTDTADAPLASVGNATLLVPAAHPVLSSSGLGALAVLEALAAAVMQLNPEAAVIARDLSDMVFSYLATSDQASGPLIDKAAAPSRQARR